MSTSQPAEQRCSGTLQTFPKGGGALRDPALSYRPTSDDPFVPAKVIREHGLVAGAHVLGTTTRARPGFGHLSFASSVKNS